MKKPFIILSILIFFLGIAFSVQASDVSLYLSPSSGTYTIGSTFPVVVKVNSGGQAINAAEGVLVFDTEELEVVNISKSSSIFTLWTTEPTFCDSSGKISFGGGTPSNFTGSSGTIITIVFKAKSNALAKVNFSSGSVLAADGKGTNILTSMISGIYVIQAKVVAEPSEEYIPPSVPTGAPAAPVVSSSTHSDLDEWYSNNEPEFFWELPPDVTGVSLALHPEPFADPGPVSDGLMISKKYENVEGGIWYFHIKFKNKYGWGNIAHRKVLIALDAPIITDFPQTAQVGDTLLIKGTSEYPDAIVTVFVKKEGEEPKSKDVKTDKDGNWLFIYDKSLEQGTYQIWVEITDNQGAKSILIEKITLAVSMSPLLKFAKTAINYIAIMITLAVLIIVLVLVLLYGGYYICHWRERVKRETKEAKRSIARAFQILEEEIKEQVEYFDKKPGLSKREKEIHNKLQRTLDISKEFITKEIKDILKELK